MTDKKPAQPPDFGQQLGVMYKRWTLDCVVTIGHAVSLDFSDRPHLYEKVSAETATKLTKLQGDYGFQANFPDVNIRQRLMKPIFGQSDGHGSGNDGSEFQQLRLSALVAAAKFSENAQPTGFPMLRKTVRDACDQLKSYMSIHGASLSQTEVRTKFIFDVAQSILKDPDVSGRFGITSGIDPKWPLDLIDPQGSNLIGNISDQLSALPYGVIKPTMFEHIQQIATDGFESIRIILDQNIDDPSFDLDPLITELYAWDRDLNPPAGMAVGTAPSAAQVSTQATATRMVKGTSTMPYKR